MALDIKTAGMEFVKSVITLYRSAKYFGEKEILSKKLLNYSIETGRLINETGLCSEKRVSAYAKKSLRELNKALFVLKVMEETGIYSKRRIQPVEKLSEQIKELLSLYITQKPEQSEVIEKPFTASVVTNEQQQLNIQPLLTEMSDDGFNEVYTGELKLR